MNQKTTLTAQEAYKYALNGGIVSRGGYIFGKDFYFAYGTYPGCVRKGGITADSFSLFDEWEAVTERDIVCRIGYAYDPFVRPQVFDGTVDFSSLRKFLEERLTVQDYKDTGKNAKACREYFRALEDIEG